MKKIFAFLAIAAMCFVSCSKDNGNDNKKKHNDDENNDEEQVYKAPITIDGEFADWAALDATKVAKATSDPASPWNAVKEIRVYADEMYVFYYIEYDSAQIGDLLAAGKTPDKEDHDGLPIRLNLNTDGEFTSGYTSYSLDGYDFIIEGSLAQAGEWVEFDGTLHQRIGSWVELLAPGNGLCTGAGKDNKYEIQLTREVFNSAALGSTVPMPMGETFQAGIRFYTNTWAELGNMPDGAVTEDNTGGYGHLLNVTTVK